MNWLWFVITRACAATGAPNLACVLLDRKIWLGIAFFSFHQGARRSQIVTRCRGQHFELLSRTGDVASAFRVLERVWGRTLVGVLKDLSKRENSGAVTGGVETPRY